MSLYKNVLYLRTITDDLELPLAVSDNVQELSEMTGNTIGSIYSLISRHRKGWYRVEVDDD